MHYFISQLFLSGWWSETRFSIMPNNNGKFFFFYILSMFSQNSQKESNWPMTNSPQWNSLNAYCINQVFRLLHDTPPSFFNDHHLYCYRASVLSFNCFFFVKVVIRAQKFHNNKPIKLYLYYQPDKDFWKCAGKD